MLFYRCCGGQARRSTHALGDTSDFFRSLAVCARSRGSPLMHTCSEGKRTSGWACALAHAGVAKGGGARSYTPPPGQ